MQDAERQINCVAVHPSRPHLAASGASAGSVAVWDLRFAARPAHATLPGDAGEVWEVRAQLQELTRRDRWSGSFRACCPAEPPEAMEAERAGQEANPACWCGLVEAREAADPPACGQASTHSAGQCFEVPVTRLVKLQLSGSCRAGRQVRFDPFAESQPALLFCTDAGVLATCAAVPGGSTHGCGGGDGALGTRALYEEAASGIPTFDVEAAGGQDIFAGTEQECLVYIRRPAA